MTLEKLSKLRGDVDRLKRDEARAEAVLDETLKTLKTLGYANLDDASAKLEQLDAKAKQAEAKAERALEKFAKEFSDEAGQVP